MGDKPEFKNTLCVPGAATGSNDETLLDAFSSINAAHSNDLAITINKSAVSLPEASK